MPLAEDFLSSYTTARNLFFSGFSEDAKRLLNQYDYPGNARELRNIIELAAIQCRSGQIEPQHIRLQNPIREKSFSSVRENGKSEDYNKLLEALEQTKWNRRKATKKLGIPYSTFRYKLKNMGID